MSQGTPQPIRIELTPEQKEQLRKATGQDIAAFEFTAEELEQRIAPRLGAN
jgi:hypothetical protein